MLPLIFVIALSMDLLLTLYRDACYFLRVTHTGLREDDLAKAEQMTVESLQEAGITQVEDCEHLESESRRRRDTTYRPHLTTLDAMRDKYKDLLANFHCQGVPVYELILDVGTGHGDSGEGNDGV